MLVFWFKNLLGALLLPPANGLLLLALAALFRRRRWAGGLGWAGGLLLLLQSLPLVSGALLAPLEDRAGLPPQGPNGAQAIVVLGGGMVETLPSLGGDQPKDGTLVRLRYAARYARSWHLPVLVSGGRPPNRVYSEAEVMARILEQEFAVPVRWREDGSRDTAENAQKSAAILLPQGIRRIALVTQPYHFPRAERLFRAAGFEVVNAPAQFMTQNGRAGLALSDFIPRASALERSYLALHEWLGIGWASLTVR